MRISNVTYGCTVFTWFIVVASVDASTETNGPNGVNATGLGLDGSGVTVGQVEGFRPGDPARDMAANHNDFVEPDVIRIQDNESDPPVDGFIGDGHATRVASVLISTDTNDPNMDGDVPTGIAQGITLESRAFVIQGVAGYPDAIVAAQAIVKDRNVPLLNHSWGKPVAPGFSADGNTIVTQGLDWLAHTEDVLNVVAGNEANGIGVPTDNFNGITVGISAIQGGKYRRVSTINDYSLDMGGPRTFTDLIAPGESVLLAGNGNTQPTISASSYTAPLATGTAALLHQHANTQIMNMVPGWDADATRHQVMKAVLMNSADKLEDSGDGFRLGMSRTVLKRDGTSTWLNSDAYNPTTQFANADSIPLDLEMGAGHLNANRAFQQFSAGEHDAVNPTGTVVPQIGWDYANVNDTGSFYNEYVFTDPLPAGSFVSITLAWDRLLSLDADGGTQGAYDPFDTFEIAGDFDEGFNDLDIYLLPKDSVSIEEAIARSISPVSNLEHLFFKIPTTGMYEFWVYEFDGPVSLNDTDYAVAWWAFNGPPGPMFSGDYDGNGSVDMDDYDLWVANFGSTSNLDADGNGNGIIDAADYTVWRDNLGASSGSAAANVPKPSALMLLTIAGAVLPLSRKRRWPMHLDTYSVSQDYKSPSPNPSPRGRGRGIGDRLLARQ